MKTTKDKKPKLKFSTEEALDWALAYLADVVGKDIERNKEYKAA